MNHRRRFYLLISLAGLAIGLATFSLLTAGAAAAPVSQQATPETPGALQLSIADSVCLECHNQPGATYTLENGDLLDLYVPAEEHQSSVHGQMGYACVQCHPTVGNYPHPPFQAADLRDASLQLFEACKRCHAHQYELALDSVHGAKLESGNRQAAICSDCHTAHAVRRITNPQTRERLPDSGPWIAETCAGCHSLIYEKYKESVHGSALIGQGNQDVPACTDCHGVHNIEDPTTTAFRLASPQLCAKCHIDPSIMGKYGISTNVLNTYVADFHGTTVTLFEQQTPDAETNKPVCYDCHGVHDIARADDPQKGLQARQNLLARCQVCHPDATDTFPDSWLSHYIPSPDKYPVVYYVDLFYKIMIPGILGGMAVLVALDFGRMTYNRFGKKKKASSEHSTDVEPLEPVAEAQPMESGTTAVEISEPQTTVEIAAESPVEPPDQSQETDASESDTATSQSQAPISDGNPSQENDALSDTEQADDQPEAKDE